MSKMEEYRASILRLLFTVQARLCEADEAKIPASRLSKHPRYLYTPNPENLNGSFPAEGPPDFPSKASLDH